PFHTEQINFDLGTQYVPRLSLGLVGANDVGFRVSWWGFATGDHQEIPGGSPLLVSSASPLGLGFTAEPARILSFFADAPLNLNVWDFEVTYDWRSCAWSYLVSGGLRYAHLGERYDVALIQGTTAATVNSGDAFDGVGPTLYFKARRELGDTRVYLFGDVRG